MKKCSKCKCNLPENRKHNYCTNCAREYHSNYKRDRSEYYKKYDAKRYQNETYRKNKIEKVKEWKKANKEKVDSFTKKYYQDNKERISKNKLLWKQKQYKNNINYKIENILRSRFHHAISRALINKSQSSIDLLGCSIDEFKSHIEKQFKDGMTWENWSFNGWHIDHIRPVASFDLSDKKQQQQCFHYTNLQPLWAKDNLKKSDSWDQCPDDIELI